MSKARWFGAWLIACVSAWNLSACIAEEKIVWAESFLAARNQAEHERRLILLHFYNDNCPPCAQRDHEVFPDKSVQEAIARNYVALKVHAKKSPGLANKYEIHQWPIDVIVSPTGQEIYRTVSPDTPEKYCAMLNNIALQGGVGAGRTAASQPPANEANHGSKPPMGASPAGWNDGQQPQNYGTAQSQYQPQQQPYQPQQNTSGAPAPGPATVVNPWLNQATQATQSAGQAAQQWGNYAQGQSQQAAQYMQQATTPAQPGATEAKVKQYVQPYQQAAQQSYQQYRDTAQQTANQFQQQGQQTAQHWQEQAAQVQQRANSYQAAAGQAVDDYSAAGGRAASAYRDVANQTAQGTTAAANQTIDTVRHSTGQVVDNIANAATMPSQLPPRRNSYGGGQFVTNVAPQPGHASEGTTEVPRPGTIRTGEATMPPAVRSNRYQDPHTTNPNTVRSNVTPGPFSNYPDNAPTAVPGSPPPTGPTNTPWNVPPANRGATDASRTRTQFEVPEWQPGSATPPAEKPAWNNDPNPAMVARNSNGTAASNERRSNNDGPPVAPQVVDNIPSRTSSESSSTAANAPTGTASNTPASNAASQPQFAMDGFCPVTLSEGKKWIKGDPKYGASHRGQTYLFASAADQQKFLANADRYAPVLGGHDPVRFADGAGQLVPGKREHGIMCDNQIYLFAEEESLRQFSLARDRYVDVVNQTNRAMADADKNRQRR